MTFTAKTDYISTANAKLEQIKNYQPTSFEAGQYKTTLMVEAMQWVISNEPKAIETAKKKRIKADILNIRTQLIQLATEYKENYDRTVTEIKKACDEIPKPEYIFTTEKNQEILDKNLRIFNSYTNAIAAKFGEWFYEQKLKQDPLTPDSWGELISIKELQFDNDLNRPWYPDANEQLNSMPYGALLLDVWLAMVSLWELVLEKKYPGLTDYNTDGIHNGRVHYTNYNKILAELTELSS